MSLITIDPKKIQLLSEEGGMFIFKPEAEEALKELLALQELVNNAVDKALDEIKQVGEGMSADFKVVKGKELSVRKQLFGNRYTYKKAKVGVLGPYLKEVSYHTVDSEAVDRYLETVGELPDGIKEKIREYKMIIKKDEEITP